MEVMNVMAPVTPRRIEVVPLMGESSYAGTYSQVNQMVLQFTRYFGARPYFLLAPLVVSSIHMKNELLEDISIREAVECWERLTYAFVGIGALPSTEGHILYLADEYGARLTKAGVVGDITSRFFKEDGQFIQIDLHERILGIEIEQLKRVKNVLAAACGVDKVRATHAALRTGLITDLFVDEELGNALLLEFDSQGTGVEVGSGGR
jgi:DNA-binding transcriptional regulator LsrR (DeoR family)